MKALIIHAGAHGGGLVPSTLLSSLPMIEFANKPLVSHQIEALEAVGVTEVIMLTDSPTDEMLKYLAGIASEYGIRIKPIRASEPLGTTKPILLARDKLIDSTGDPFFVLFSDTLCEFSMLEMIAFHRSRGGESSVMVTTVDTPTHGVLLIEEGTGRVIKQVDNPKSKDGNTVSAGIYLHNQSILNPRPTSTGNAASPRTETESHMYAMALQGFWVDINRPVSYISGLKKYLASLKLKSPSKLASGSHIRGNVLVDESAVIGEGCVIGPDVAIGPKCIIAPRTVLARCAVLVGSRINSNTLVNESIIGYRSTVGCFTRIWGWTILGANSHVGDGLLICGAAVWAGGKIDHNQVLSA